MSIPISTCLIRQALTNDDALEELANRLIYNAKFGSMLIFECKCEVKHEVLTDEETEVMIKRLEAEDVRMGRSKGVGWKPVRKV